MAEEIGIQLQNKDGSKLYYPESKTKYIWHRGSNAEDAIDEFKHYIQKYPVRGRLYCYDHSNFREPVWTAGKQTLKFVLPYKGTSKKSYTELDKIMFFGNWSSGSCILYYNKYGGNAFFQPITASAPGDFTKISIEKTTDGTTSIYVTAKDYNGDNLNRLTFVLAIEQRCINDNITLTENLSEGFPIRLTPENIAASDVPSTAITWEWKSTMQ